MKRLICFLFGCLRPKAMLINPASPSYEWRFATERDCARCGAPHSEDDIADAALLARAHAHIALRRAEIRRELVRKVDL